MIENAKHVIVMAAGEEKGRILAQALKDPGNINEMPVRLTIGRTLVLDEETGVDYLINPLNKKLTEDELAEMVYDFDVIIAGTEPITAKVMDPATNLKLISRVGIGLDSVDLLAAEKQVIQVSFTPDAPAPFAYELTMLDDANTITFGPCLQQ